MALQTLQRMRSDPSRYPTPNTVCYNAALMALARQGRWQEARELLTDVAAAASSKAVAGEEEGDREVGRGRDVEEGGGGGEAGEGREGAAAEVLDFLSYNSVIRACAVAGEAEEVS